MIGAIARLHADYLTGRLSPVEVLERTLAWAQADQPRLNAFTTLRGEAARREAEAAARRYREGAPRSVLDGIPLSVKDLIHVAGMPTTAASHASTAAPAEQDAPAVAALKAAGAVVFAKTNLLEYAYGVVHPAFGPAHNPWDPSRTAGGSSSGSAVAVAAGIGLASLGTDTAGSVRNPAALCGTVGLKPTYGTLSTEGVIPLAPTLDHVGVLAASVEDARLVVEAMTGRPLRRRAEQPLRLGVARPGPVAPEVAAVVEGVLRELSRRGAVLREVQPLDFGAANAACLTILYAEALEVHAQRLPERWQGYSSAMRSRLLAGAGVSGADYLRARAVQADLGRAWQAALEGLDAVVWPTLPTVAPPEGEVRDLAAATLFTSALALMGVPAVSVPAGLAGGLPVGLQVAGRRGDDLTVLEVAARVEAARGPFPAAPGFHDLWGS